MKKIKKFLVFAALFLSFILTGCVKIIDLSGNSGNTATNTDTKSNKATPTPTAEKNTPIGLTVANFNQNDYAGACCRINKIRTAVKASTSVLDDYSKKIMDENPGDYWDVESYFFLDFLPVYDEEFENTVGLNEKDSEEILNGYYKNLYTNKGGGNFNFFKRDANNYFIRYTGNFVNQSTWKKINGTCEEVCAYDPMKGALNYQMVAYDGNKRLITTHFYEFVPIGGNTYIFQDADERMCVEYDGTTVKSFTYSKLNAGYKYKINNSVPTKLNEESVADYYKEKTTDVNLENGAEDNVTEDYSDSIFFNKDALGPDWVFEKDNFSKKILYDGKDFDITVLNEFNNEYENIYIEVE